MPDFQQPWADLLPAGPELTTGTPGFTTGIYRDTYRHQGFYYLHLLGRLPA